MGGFFLFSPLGCGNGGAVSRSATTRGSTTTSPSGVVSQVSTTHNSHVALYTVMSPKDGTLSVSFGKTTSYGRATANQPVSAGKTVRLYVAGMLATSVYHMQATIQLADGSTISDLDHTFTTGAPPANGSISTSGLRFASVNQLRTSGTSQVLPPG